MTLGQLTLIFISVVITGGVYLFAPLLPPDNKTPEHAVTASATPDFDLEEFKKMELEKLPAEDFERYQLMQNILKTTDDKLAVLKDITTLFEHNNLGLMAALTRKEAASFSEVDSVWKSAANNLYSNAFSTDNQSLFQYVLSEAIACYEKVLELNPDETDVKISLAVAHLEGRREPMKGVMLLREITDKDPDNITANLILGKYGIVSGQFDKAIIRLEKVLSIDSLNADAYLYLAEAYEGKGDNARAVEALEKCKSLITDSGFSNELSKYIEKLKNS